MYDLTSAQKPFWVLMTSTNSSRFSSVCAYGIGM